jgi:K+/H+ antiporter YhaU regulatory subunit KhtT
MLGIVGIVAFLVVLGLSLFITRLATIALMLTGMSHQAAKFQARSAFTGTGFTTTEAERVVDHPARRRIITVLMIVRSAGLMSIIISLILSFIGSSEELPRLNRLLWLVGGVFALWLVTRLSFVDKALNRLIASILRRWTDLDTRDYESLLHLSGDYAVNELKIQEGDWLAGKELSECRLRDEGITVLGVYRGDGSYVGAPGGDTNINAGDTVILYGQEERLRNLDARRAGSKGEVEHRQAADEARRTQQEELLEDEERQETQELEEEVERRKQRHRDREGAS